MNISIGADHAGFKLKEHLKRWLEKNHPELVIHDVGTYSEERTDYPKFAHGVADRVQENDDGLGLLICGSANGVAMAANKHKGIRCAIAWKKELAELARQHNNANVLALPSRFIDDVTAENCLEGFLSSSFEGGRHSKRVEGIPCSS